ncbi:chemotaxis protein CheW [Schlesneria sp.]|uniref:chemotaxis protein CheW n=1 Tax=Schlesneria sp. TaxID=2762018 RepID=UPI002F15A9F1
MKPTTLESRQLFCTFRLDGQLFGVDILDVKEVTTEITCTQIAHSPDEVRGLVNIRGHIHLALDMRGLLGLPAVPRTDSSRLILFKPAVGSAFGVIVDEIAEIHAVTPHQIEPFTVEQFDALTSQLRRIDLIDSVAKLARELLVILNPRRFLRIVETNFAGPA